MITKHQYLSKDDPQSVKSQSLPLHLSFCLEYAQIMRDICPLLIKSIELKFSNSPFILSHNPMLCLF